MACQTVSEQSGESLLKRCHSNLHCSRFAEDVRVDVQHQVAAARVLRDETNVLGRLEARVQVDQEGVPRFGSALEYSSLHH